MQRLYPMQQVLDPSITEPNNTKRGKGIGMSSLILPPDLTKVEVPAAFRFFPRDLSSPIRMSNINTCERLTNSANIDPRWLKIEPMAASLAHFTSLRHLTLRTCRGFFFPGKKRRFNSPSWSLTLLRLP